ncbi:MAG: sugar transferase [Cyanobacteria bacterium]|nr:sugar transferase [Cyanobacteriota bacterium]MDW8202563.1 sugar transferase [Cyanobacteriota bacterium SKYGB_h_bin112]
MTAETQYLPGKVTRTLSRLKFPLPRSCPLDQDAIKRVFDIVFSLAVLIIFSPLYLLIALLIVLTSPGPIFYVQQRIGRNYQPFGCIKFRTMHRKADEALQSLIEASPQLRREFEANFKLKRDPRVTWIGRFLRATSLDEFPQFWNVLKGEMSVVGPRPLVKAELIKYGKYIDQVLTIRPGITGLWQVSGRNDVPYPLRVKMDLYYVRSRSLSLDCWLIIRTIRVVIFPRNNGAY